MYCTAQDIMQLRQFKMHQWQHIPGFHLHIIFKIPRISKDLGL